MLGKSLIKSAAGNAGVVPSDPNFANTVLLLNGDGTNGGQNNTFLDSSSNAHTITRNGNVTQGSFSPFAKDDGKWGVYFDAASSYIRSSTEPQLSGDFTIEAWLYPQSLSNTKLVFSSQSNTNVQIPRIQTNGGVYVYINGTELNSGSTATDLANLNEWHHFALTRSGSTVYAFVNGTEIWNTTFTGTFNVGVLGAFFFSGGYYTSADYDFDGYISNARVIAGTALYTADFTVPTAPLTAVTNTELLFAQSNRFIDNSTNNYSFTTGGTPKVTTFSPFPQTLPYSAETNGGSGYFDGNGDNLSVSTSLTPTGGFTVEAWVYKTASAKMQIFASDLSPNNRQFAINSSQQIEIYDGAVVTSTGTINLNEWNHVAVSRSGSTYYFFINGEASGTGSASNSMQFDRIGALGINNGPFEGYISDVRLVDGTALYTSAFTPPTAPLTDVTNTSLLCNFTNASITDLTGSNVLETVGNAQVDTTTFKYGTGALEFDGTGDYLVSTNSDYELGAGDFTVEGWVYPRSIPNGVFQMASIVPSNTTNGLALISSTATNNPWTVYFDGVNITTSYPTLNTWQHFALVRDGATLTLYIDGTSVFTKAVSTTALSSTDTLVVGMAFSSTYAWDGYIDDLRITKGIARYTADFTPPTAELPKVGE